MKFDFLDVSKYFKIHDWCIRNLPDIKFAESLYPNQISSKLWLVDELSKIPELNVKPIKLEIVGSWFGWPLVQMLSDKFEVDNIQMYDMDKNVCRVSYQYREIFGYNKDQIGITTANYWQRSNRKSPADLVINCSSEHMLESFYKYPIYKKDCIFAIQSNNMKHIAEHINCVDNEEELIKKHKIKEILYAGQQDTIEWDGFKIKKTDHKRFMVIGKI